MKKILGFLVFYSKDKTSLMIQKEGETDSSKNANFTFSWVRKEGELIFYQSCYIIETISYFKKALKGDKFIHIEENESLPIFRNFLTDLELQTLTIKLTKFMGNTNSKHFYYKDFIFPKIVAMAIWEFTKGHYLDFKETEDETLDFTVRTIPNVFDKLK